MKTLTINPYSVKGTGQVFIKIKFSDDGRLSISGVESPNRHGNCRGSCGQIDMSYKEHCQTPGKIVPNTGYTLASIKKLMGVWKTYHLNDMTKGTPAQEQAVNAWLAEGNAFDYDRVCGYLKSIGLYTDKLPDGVTVPANALDEHGLYKYAHAWLKTEVPAGVIEWLFSLPVTKRQPAWV